MTLLKYSEDEARDDHGQWTSGGSYESTRAEFAGMSADAISTAVTDRTGTKVDFGGQRVNKAKWADAAAMFVSLHEQFPTVRVTGIKMAPGDRGSPVLARMTTGPWQEPSLTLVSKYWGAGSPPIRAAEGWWPKGMDNPAGLMAHEFGHAVDDAAAKVSYRMTLVPGTPEAWRGNELGSLPAISEYGKTESDNENTRVHSEKFAELFGATYSGLSDAAPPDQAAGLKAYLGATLGSATKINKYSDSQERVPAGSPEGGEFAGGAMSADEATTRLGATFPGIRTSLDKMDPTLRGRTVRQLEKLGKAYPEVHLTGIGTQPSNTKGMGRNTAFVPLYGSTMHLNEAQFRSADKMALLNDKLKEYEQQNGRPWTVVAQGNPEDAITHEFGHLVDGNLLSMVGGGPGMPIVSDYARKSGSAYTEGFAEAFVQAANGMDTPAAKYVNDKVAQARSWRSSKLAKRDVSDEARDEGGKWTDGGGGNPAVSETTRARLIDVEEVQRGRSAASGKEYGVVLDAATGRIKWNAPGGDASVSLPIGSGDVFTHTHPSNEGLSAQDVKVAVDSNCAEMRAITQDGTWRVGPPVGGWQSVEPDLTAAVSRGGLYDPHFDPAPIAQRFGLDYGFEPRAAHKYSESQERDEAGRWTSGGGDYIGVRADELPVGTRMVYGDTPPAGIPISFDREHPGITLRGDRTIDCRDPRIPDTVYHMTTNLPEVQKDGYLMAGGKGGLGGDAHDRIVSMTLDPGIAQQLVDDVKLNAAAWQSNDPVAVYTAQADKEGWGDKWRTSWPFKDGQPYEHLGYSAGDWSSAYFPIRQSTTGARDPLFFGDSGKYVDPERVGVVALPKENLDNGALLVNFDLDRPSPWTLQEIRSYGDVPLKGATFTKAAVPALYKFATVTKVSGLAFADGARAILQAGLAAAYVVGKKTVPAPPKPPVVPTVAPVVVPTADNYDDHDWYDELDDDGQQAVDDASDGVNERLLGLGALLLGGAVSAAMLDAWMGTYAASLNPLYEEGFQSGVAAQGEIEQVEWQSEEDDTVCQGCRALDGMTWVGDEIDASMPHPGDSEFGGRTACGPMCRCQLIYSYVPTDEATYSMGGYDDSVEEMSTADLLKVWAILAGGGEASSVNEHRAILSTRNTRL